MKATSLLKLLPLCALLLTGCDQSLKQEDYEAKLQEVKTHLVEHADEITNIRIQDTNKLGQESYNYKEGEFYCHSYTDGVILIIPTTAKVATWKEGDKYYHGENYNFFKTDVVTHEITKEEFDAYLLAGKNTIMEQLMYPVTRAEALISGEAYPEGHKPENKFVKTYKGEFKLSSTEPYQVSSESEWQTRKVTIMLKGDMPLKYITKEDSEKGWNYQPGKAKVDIPTWSEDSSESN